MWNILVGKTYWFYLTKSLQKHNNLKAEKIKNPGPKDQALSSFPKNSSVGCGKTGIVIP
jgi:hypothetical protein